MYMFTVLFVWFVDFWPNPQYCIYIVLYCLSKNEIFMIDHYISYGRAKKMKIKDTIMMLTFRTDMSWQTMQTQSLIMVFTV